jgi:hypothetical protein
MIRCEVKLIRFHAANQEIKLSFEISLTKFVTNLISFYYLLVFHAAFNLKNLASHLCIYLTSHCTVNLTSHCIINLTGHCFINLT